MQKIDPLTFSVLNFCFFYLKFSKNVRKFFEIFFFRFFFFIGSFSTLSFLDPSSESRRKTRHGVHTKSKTAEQFCLRVFFFSIQSSVERKDRVEKAKQNEEEEEEGEE